MECYEYHCPRDSESVNACASHYIDRLDDYKIEIEELTNEIEALRKENKKLDSDLNDALDVAEFWNTQFLMNTSNEELMNMLVRLAKENKMPTLYWENANLRKPWYADVVVEGEHRYGRGFTPKEALINALDGEQEEGDY